MAQGQPRGGCFRCGNPHHSAWECKADLSHDEEKVNRRINQDHHVLFHPEVKKALNQKSYASHVDRRSAKSQAHHVPWQSIISEVQRLLLIFRDWNQRLSVAGHRQFPLSEAASRLHFESLLAMQNEIRTSLEAVRHVTATGNQKCNDARLGMGSSRTTDISLQDLSMIYGKLQELSAIRDAVWASSVTFLKVAKNVAESISDLVALQAAISEWCSSMRAWVASSPPAVDQLQYDAQITTQRSKFLQMEQRGAYIAEHAHLEAEVKAVLQSVRQQLEEADSLRADFTRGWCSACRHRRTAVNCRCSLGLCRLCYGTLTKCPRCGLNNVFSD